MPWRTLNVRVPDWVYRELERLCREWFGEECGRRKGKTPSGVATAIIIRFFAGGDVREMVERLLSASGATRGASRGAPGRGQPA